MMVWLRRAPVRPLVNMATVMFCNYNNNNNDHDDNDDDDDDDDDDDNNNNNNNRTFVQNLLQCTQQGTLTKVDLFPSEL
jgi:hypothetical protein